MLTDPWSLHESCGSPFRGEINDLTMFSMSGAVSRITETTALALSCQLKYIRNDWFINTAVIEVINLI